MAYNAATMSFDLPDTDTVYVSGLPSSITERDVEEFFGSIGTIQAWLLHRRHRAPPVYVWTVTGGTSRGPGRLTS